MAVDKAKVDQEVVVERREDASGGVVVELDEKNKPVPAKSAEKLPKEEPKYVRPDELEEKLRKSNAAYFAEQRKTQEEIRKLREDLIKSYQPPPKPEVPQDEWDLKVQKDWKGTVRELARAEASELRKKEVEEERIRFAEMQRQNLSFSNQQKVLEKHPELNDITSDKARIFQEVVSKNPEYVSNPFGPVLAMRDMEDELRAQGKLDESSKKIVESEVNRRTRTNASTIPPGASAGGNKRYVLSGDDKAFCDLHKIPYDKYIANQQIQQLRGVVEA